MSNNVFHLSEDAEQQESLQGPHRSIPGMDQYASSGDEGNPGSGMVRRESVPQHSWSNTCQQGLRTEDGIQVPLGKFINVANGQPTSLSINRLPELGQQVFHAIIPLRDYRGSLQDYERIVQASSRMVKTSHSFFLLAEHRDHIHAVGGVNTRGSFRIFQRLFKFVGRPTKCKTYEKEEWTFARFQRLWRYLETGIGRYVSQNSLGFLLSFQWRV